MCHLNEARSPVILVYYIKLSISPKLVFVSLQIAIKVKVSYRKMKIPSFSLMRFRSHDTFFPDQKAEERLENSSLNNGGGWMETSDSHEHHSLTWYDNKEDWTFYLITPLSLQERKL